MNYAILIGINEYKFYPHLRYAKNDARAVQETLVGRDREAFAEDNTHLFIDDEDSLLKPTISNILSMLKEISQNAREGDLIFFYFAGHGFEWNDTGYLVVGDTLNVGDTQPDIATGTALSVSAVLEIMDESKASDKVVILDACREGFEAGSHSRSVTKSQNQPRPLGLTLQEVIRKQTAHIGWEIIVACGPGQLAWEEDEFSAGVWTYYLLKAIEELQKGHNVTVKNLFDEVTKKAKDTTQLKGKKAPTPCYYSSKEHSAIIFPASEPATGVGSLDHPLLEAMREYGGHGVKTLTQTEERVFKITDKWNHDSEEPSIHLVPFTSYFKREDLEELSSECSKANQDFYLRLYLPSRKVYPGKHKRIYLLFNGLGESNPAIFDDIGWTLANRKGIPAVLIPAPSHFIREYRFDSSMEDPYIPIDNKHMRLATQFVLQGVMQNPNRIINGYKQIIEDANSFLRMIRQGFDPYWSKLFTKDPSISLFGYSLGGFAALSLLLLDGKRFNSVFLLESGAFIDQIDVSVLFRRNQKVQKALWETYYEKRTPIKEKMDMLFSSRESEAEERFVRALRLRNPQECKYGNEPWSIFDRDEIESRAIWSDIVTTLYKEIESHELALTGEEKQVFKRVFLGYESLIQKESLAKLEDKILVIAGGADDIFPARLLLSSGPKTGLAMLQIPQLSHWLKFGARDSWSKWSHRMIDFMEIFN